MALFFHILKPEDKMKISDLYAKLGGRPLSLPWEPEDIGRFIEGEIALFVVLKLEEPEEIEKLMAQRPHYKGKLG